MTKLTVTARTEVFKLTDSFTISRGDKTEVEVIVCEVSDATHTGLSLIHI